MNSRFRTLTVWSLLIMILFVVYHMFISSQKDQLEFKYSRFLDQVEENNVAEVILRGKVIDGRLHQTPNGILKFAIRTG